MAKPNEMQMWKCDLKIPCHTASCTGRAAYYVGKPEKRYDALILCEKCARELVANIPDELLPMCYNPEPNKVAEVYGEISESFELSDLTVRELKRIASDKQVTGYSNMTKDELVEAIKGAE